MGRKAKRGVKKATVNLSEGATNLLDELIARQPNAKQLNRKDFVEQLVAACNIGLLMDRTSVVEILIKYQFAIEEAVAKAAFAEEERLREKHGFKKEDVIVDIKKRYEISPELLRYVLEDMANDATLAEIDLPLTVTPLVQFIAQHQNMDRTEVPTAADVLKAIEGSERVRLDQQGVQETA